MTRRIGILMTATDTPPFAAEFPDDGEAFRTLLSPLRPDWQFSIVYVKDGEFPGHAADFDGYVITGSPATVTDDRPWIKRLLGLIREVEAVRIPVAGICFGHQAIALALGGKVERAAQGWGYGVSETRHERFAPWMTPAKETIRLYTAHRDQVTVLPIGAELLGGSDHCPIGSYRVGEHVFTTEHHPEMTAAFMRRLTDHLEDYLEPSIIARARLDIETPQDGGLMARWIVQFLERTPLRG
ncbi:MAG: gamma-glutamyl-gamma-aminobutyrate hydrolase family protein [Hyphomicrobiaceae bacterium]